MNFEGSLQVGLWRMVVVGFLFFFLASAEKEVDVMDGFHGPKRELLLLIRGRRLVMQGKAGINHPVVDVFVSSKRELLMQGKAGINHPVVDVFVSSKREVPGTFDPLHNR